MAKSVDNFVQSPPGILPWIIGDAPAARDALAKYSWKSPVVVVKIIDSLLRGIAQVVFAGNPVSGLFILVGLFVSDITCGLGAVVCSLTAIFASKLLNWPNATIEAGLTNFSPVLVGTVTASLYPVFFHQPLTAVVWGYMILASVFSLCVSGGLGRILAVHHIPAYTLPFNVAASLTFVCLRASGYAADDHSSPSIPPPTAASDVEDQSLDVQWSQVWMGTLLSAGQVWAVESIAGSSLVLLGLWFCSPILTIVCYMGAVVATFTALMVSPAPYSSVYAGVWGYNGFLAAGAIAFFMVPTPRTLLLAAINAVFATFIQGAMSPVFAATQLPVFTFPFCLASVVFLATAMAVSPSSVRVASPSFPELHLVLYSQKTRDTITMKNRGEYPAGTDISV